MAVAPMQKVRLLVHSTDVDMALDIIQRAGALEFKPTELPNTITPQIPFPHAQLLPRVEHATQFLAPYAPKVRLWQTLREGSRIEVTEEKIAKQLQDTDVVAAVVDDLERLQVEFAEIEEKIRFLEEQHELLAEWKDLPIELGKFATKRTTTLLVKGHQATEDHPLKKIIETLCNEQNTPHVITEVSVQLVALTIANDPALLAKAKGVLESADAEIITAPEGSEFPEIEFAAVSDRLAKARGEFALLVDQAEHFAITHYKMLRIAIEILTWQRERYEAIEKAIATKYSVIFDGWLMKDHRISIELAIREKKLAAVIADIEPESGEEPPVEIINSSLVQPFEAVTRLYGMPGYRDLDPTVFLAGFFFLFFGLSLTDVGYGLSLVVAAAFFLFFCKLSKAARSFTKLFLFIGLGTVIVGALFGGYFGVDPTLLPEPLQKIQLFDPIGDPLAVFYLSLALGVFQTMFGLALKIYSDARNRQLIAGVLDQGPWLLMFFFGILHLLTTLGYVSMLNTGQTKNLLLVGAVLIILGAGRNGKGFFGKFISAAGGLYAGVSYFSDILSYSRLLALGLATSALAYAVNLIASMLNDIPYVGFLLAAIVLFIGHLFTLIINTLGAFVHSARLQFVEFFGKFISGSGKTFTPLKRSHKYITIGDD
jgi:V/A-type H+-transporting ATPase subunit I